MPSERTQRQIDRLLDSGEQAIVDRDWARLAQLASDAISLDPGNADALSFADAAERNLDESPAEPSLPDTTAVPAAAASAAEPAARPPSSFAAGRYEVREFLGEGGKKRVFLAYDGLLDREVAFALIRTEGLDAAGRERITREAQAMARLGDHPHIVPVLDLGQEEVGGVLQPYIVSQYMAGGSAKELLAEADGDLPLERTLALAIDVCRGLEAAHGDNVVHRDLSLGNVWLSEETATGSGRAVAKIGDFGLAVSLDRTRLTQQGVMVGTATYMPPEQALGGAVTPQSDLYSLGVMLFELVTGRPPFVGDDLTAVISQHINTPPVAPSWHSEYCPPALEALILHLLEKVPEDRPGSASAVLEVLEGIDPEGTSAQPTDTNPLERLAQGVFVGREQELERVRSAFDRAVSGTGGVVMVAGEPGVGKTRMVMEVETHARMRGAQVLWGRAHEAAGAPAYWPWLQALRSHVAATDEERLRSELGSGASEVARVVSELGERLPDLPKPDDITDPESAQFRLFDAISVFLRNASTNTPLVVVLDDLHWADRPTLLLIAHIAREISRSRLLIVGTYRDSDLDREHPLSAALATMNREQLFERVSLHGLTRDEVDAYVRRTANEEPSRQVRDRIFEETEGNPFFLSQVVALMAQQGALAATSLSEIALPEGVAQVLGQRLDGLSEQCNELLRLAAVNGREFSHEMLAASSEHEDAGLLQLVEEALDGRVIEETGTPGGYRFIHALMQETLLEEISAARRSRMHARIAESLQQLWGDDVERHAAELARHYVAAASLNRSHAARALHYSKRAAEQSMDEAAWDEAARHYEIAIGLLASAAEQEDEAELELARSAALLNAFNERAGWSAARRALALFAERSDAVGIARAALALNSGLMLPRDNVEARDRALEALNDRAPRLKALLLVARPQDGHLQAGSLTEAARLTEGHDFPDVAARIHHHEATRATDGVRFEEPRAHHRLAHEAYARAGEFGRAARSLRYYAYSLIHEGRLSEAEPAVLDAQKYARRVHHRQTEQFCQAYLGNLALVSGEFDRAEQLIQEFEPNGFFGPLLEATRLETLGRVDQALARWAASDPRDPLQMVLQDAVQARLLFLAGEHDAAREALERWATMTPLFPAVIEITTPRIVELDGYLPALGEIALVSRVYDELCGWSGIRVGRFTARGLDHMRGALALRLDRVDDADQHYLNGLAWAERERCPIEAGRNHQGLAEVALRRNGVADALRHLDAASRLFEHHGATLYLDQVIAKKLHIQGAGSSGDTDSTITAPAPDVTLQEGGRSGPE